MNIKNITKSIFFILFSVLLFTACETDSDSDTETEEPMVIERYYFTGTLDGEELNIYRNIYDVVGYVDPNYRSMDYGGSQTNDIAVFGEPGTGYCYGRYACGLVFYDFQENPDQLDEAKMYLSKIPVGECTLENELIGINNFLELDSYTYDTYYEQPSAINNVALDFFPGDEENDLVYFSSRFGDNTDADYTITSVLEESDGVFIIEGTFSCKLYKFNDETEFKLLENGEFRIKIMKNLDE